MKNIKNNIYFRYKIRCILSFIFLLISLATCIFLGCRTLEREKLKPINYKEINSIDYKVYLNDNEFYDKDYLDMNKAYVASLIKYIDINFNYKFNIEEITNMDFDYKIIGELVIENSNNSKRYFEKTYTLLDDKNIKLQNDNKIEIDENLQIDYDYYNKLVNNFRSTYGVDTNNYLNVYLEVISKTNDYLNYKIKETNKIPIKIPLSERAIEINFDSNDKEVLKQVIPTGKMVFDFDYLMFTIVFLLISIIFFLELIKYLSLGFKRLTPYDKYVKKILKEYDRLIVEVKTKINLSKYNVLDVKEFSELLDVRDNLKVPIIYLNIIKHEEGIFYIKDNKDVYLLSVNNENLLNKKK